MWRALRETLGVYPVGARKFFIAYSALTSLLTLLDIAALGLLVMTLAPLSAGADVNLPIFGVVPSSGVPWVVVGVCVLMITKSAAALSLFRYGTTRWGAYERAMGERILRSYVHLPWDERANTSSAELTRIADTSVSATTWSFLAQLAQVPGSFFTCLAVTSVLFVAQPLNALVVVVFLGVILVLLFRTVIRQSHEAGSAVRRDAYRVATVLTEIIDALRELTLRSKLDEVVEEVDGYRERVSSSRGHLVFLTTMPRYALEVALVGSIALVGGVSYLLNGGQAVLVSVGLFGAVALRLMPSIVTLQSNLGGARANQAYAEDVVRAVAASPDLASTDTEQQCADAAVSATPAMLSLRNVHYRYPRGVDEVLAGIDLDVPMGSRLAIVGSSGSGKSTLVDIILGLRAPNEGTVQVDGVPLVDDLDGWRARIGYVPQRVSIFDASVAQNVALTWSGPIDDARVRRALEQAQLADLLERPEGLRASLGERGASISGGQQQRLGLARALYAEPIVLVLDEATSALDTTTERRVMDAVKALGSSTTFIVIAHRLATIQDFDQICYLEDGRIRGLGTFEEVRAQVPAFAAQVALAGL